TYTVAYTGARISATFQAGLHSQAGWATATSGHSRARGQNRPARGGKGPPSDLRGGLPGLLIWFPAWARCARRVRRAQRWDHEEEGELGAGCGHSGLLWVIFPPLDDYVSPASHRGSPDAPPDQEMAEGRRPRGRRMVGDGEGDSAGLGDFAAARECLPAFWQHPLATLRSRLLSNAVSFRQACVT